MRSFIGTIVGFALICSLSAIPAQAAHSVQVQFPCDIDNEPAGNFPGVEDVDWNGDGSINMLLSGGTVTAACPPNLKYMRLGASDGYAKMADGTDLYTFGFVDLTGVPEDMVMDASYNNGDFPAPTIIMNEGDTFYLNLTNVGMKMRPDLFDEHTVHFHGFPNASAVFDGEPMASIGTKMMSTLTYFYRPVDPGTYMFHCHVEATEHMEMGMLGNLVVRPQQNGTTINGYDQFVYNDGDGRTGYDVEAILKIGDFDPVFHKNDETFQPLPFADYEARYFMLNGRGYPDTIDPGVITNRNGHPAQKLNSLVSISKSGGQRTLLLRIINLSVQNFTSIEVPGLPMKVGGKCARLLRGPNAADGTGAGPGNDTSYYVNSALVGPGESIDLFIDVTGVPAGKYYLYSRNLDQLNNDLMERGGIMTEINII